MRKKQKREQIRCSGCKIAENSNEDKTLGCKIAENSNEDKTLRQDWIQCVCDLWWHGSCGEMGGYLTTNTLHARNV